MAAITQWSPFRRIKDIIRGIYLESGFLDLLYTGPCTENAFFPAKLNFDPFTAAYVAVTNTPLEGAVNATVITGEPIIASHDIEVATANGIDTALTVTVTDDTGVTVYSVGTDYTVTSTGITALSTGAIVNAQSLRVDYVVLVVQDEAPFSGSVLIAGQDSKAVGCVTKLAQVTDSCATTYSLGGYCDAGIIGKKDVQSKVPASMFSGKLRLLVQSIYGSTRSDYRLKNNFDLEIGDVAVSPFTFFRGFTNNSWLYTTANYDYFVCTFKGTSIEFRELQLSSVALKFRDILVAHARKTDHEFATRLEAYILSTATVSSTIHSTVIITGDLILGSPLDYGWHATWGGETADCISFYADVPNSQYISDHHRISIGETFNAGVYTFTAVNTRQESDKPWWPWSSHIYAFYYDETVQSMMPVDFPNPVISGSTGTFDAPIYCYYNWVAGVDTLQVSRIAMNLQNLPQNNFSYTHGTPLPEPWSSNTLVRKNFSGGIAGTISADIGGTVTTVTFAGASTNSEAHWYNAGDNWMGGWPFERGRWFQWAPGGYATANDWAIANGVTIGQRQDFNINGQQRTLEVAWWGHKYRLGIQTLTKNNYFESGKLFIQTVQGDCGCVIVGDSVDVDIQESGSYEDAQKNTNELVLNMIHTGELVWGSISNIDGYQPFFTIAGPPPGHAANYNGFLPNSNLQIIQQTTWTAPFQSSTQTLKYKNGSGGSGTPTIITPAILSEYFSPTASDKPTHTIDTARRALLSNKYKINHAAFTEDGGFINDSSVGWS